MEPTRIIDLLPRYAAIFDPKEDVLAGKENGVWKKWDIQAYMEQADAVSYALLAMGIQPGDTVATISNNRPEWNIMDIGIQQTGAIHVPIYPTISDSDYAYILKHAQARLVFISSDELLRKITPIVAKIAPSPELVTLRKSEGLRSFQELLDAGRSHPDPELLQKRKDSIQPDDVATIIYTSGTTGQPKGVMLSHANLISNFIGVSYIPTFGQEGKALSFLPLCHIYERMLNYLYHYLGISIYYAESMATIVDNVKDIKPDMMSAVPRFLEKVFDRIMAQGRKLKGIKRIIFFWAVRTAERFDVNGNNSKWYNMQHRLADRLVLSRWREALGGNFKIIVSGGAAIQPRLVRIFRAAGLPIYEGYGLTESSPVIAVTSRDANGLMLGTVGPPLRGVQVRIAEDGEILCKGPNVMKGYYKAPELTAEVIDADGWLHTGDVGVFEPGGQLRITGRKKEIFKTSLGKYIAPELIENKLKSSSFIDNAIVIGENQKFATALIVPDFAHIRSWCNVKGIPYTTDQEMAAHPRIKARMMKEINHFNASLGSTEQIRKAEILDHEWSILSGELTPTLKVKRDFVLRKYAALVEKIFGN
ncbi:MAG: long-chain fatty acid--CoA ligase [Lentimicrobiaceae bacterium]|nr:long-chain fatty acid--CoA ligase [Lentimicrobiaceae bacterium]